MLRQQDSFNLDSYVWQALSPIGARLQEDLSQRLKDKGIQVFLQIYFRSGDCHYPCYFTKANESENVLEALRPLLLTSAAKHSRFLQEILDSTTPAFWLWGLSKEKHLRNVINDPNPDYGQLPGDVLLAGFCRLTDERFAAKFATLSKALQFDQVSYSIERNIAGLKNDGTSQTLAAQDVIDTALVIEMAVLLLGLLSGDDGDGYALVKHGLEKYARGKQSIEQLKNYLMGRVKGRVANIYVPLMIGGSRVGFMSVALLQLEKGACSCDIPDGAQVQALLHEYLQQAASRLEGIFLALMSLWLVHRKASGDTHTTDPNSLSLSNLLYQNADAHCHSVNVLSAVANAVGNTLSMERELGFSWQTILHKPTITEPDAAQYALAKVLYDLREHLLAGGVFILPITSSTYPRGADQQKRSASSLLMEAAEFKCDLTNSSSKATQYYERTDRERRLVIAKKKISDQLRKAAQALEKSWAKSPIIGFHYAPTLGEPNTGMIMAWSKVFEKEKTHTELIKPDDWKSILLAAACRISKLSYQPTAAFQKHNELQNDIARRMLDVRNLDRYLKG